MSIARDIVETAHSGDDDQNRGRKCHEHREDSNNGVCRQRHSKVSAVEIDYGCDGFNGSLREAFVVPSWWRDCTKEDTTVSRERGNLTGRENIVLILYLGQANPRW